ncbi:ABC transporter ATP-binding protein [Sphingobacterium sp. WOUb80]|uniref:ABC transporter ATP-binding protein n=1 Tax=Sphingobacterium sp. WOUb80 TaxID=3234028 RepID=UPI003CECB92C
MSTSNKSIPVSLPGPGNSRRIKNEKPQQGFKALWRLMRYLSSQRLMLLLILISLLLGTAGTLAGNYLLRPAINNYVLKKDIVGLGHIALVMIGIYIATGIFNMLQYRLTIRVAQKTISNLRNDLFDRMQYLPLQFYDTHQHGDLMSRFTNDMDTVSDALNNSITQLLISSITLLGTLALMVYISPILSVIALIMIPLMLYLAKLIINKSKSFFAANQAALGNANGYVEEMISGQKVVKVFGHENAAIEQFEKLNQVLREKATKAQFYSGMMMPLMANMSTINYALTTIAGGILVITRGFDLGGLTAFLQYARQFGRPVNEISSQYNSLQAALAGAERIFAVIDTAPESETIDSLPIPTPLQGQVTLSHVNFGYVPQKQVLFDIDIDVKPGQKIAFVGETGAGKSTIINLLPRFYPLLSGDILLDKTSIFKLDRNELRKKLSIVFQDTHLFTDTVMENIRYGRLNATDEEVIAAAKLAAADSFIMQLPLGYKTELTNDGANLSQGQRQLINIARATVADTPILILDEATSSIDTRTEIAIQEGIDRLMQNKTSFVIAHRLSTIRNADMICLIEKGTIAEFGSHAELLKQKGKYYRLYMGQFD